MNSKKKILLEIIIVEFLIIVAVSVSFIPTLYYLSLASDTKVFPLIHNNHPDYYFYLSLMRQGFEGKWLVVSRFTPEQFPPQFVQTFFILLGHLSRITSISLPLIYTLSRLVLGIAVGVATYFLLVVFDKRRIVCIVGLIFVLFGSSFWFVKDRQIYQFMTFWTAFDARERTTFLPHHLLGTLAIITSIIFLTLFFKFGKKKFFVTASIAGFIGTFVNPKILANYFFALILFLVLFILLNFKNRSSYKKIIQPFLLYFIISSLPLIYFLMLRKNIFPWTTYNLLNRSWAFQLNFKEYVLGLGPTFIFSLFGIKDNLRPKDYLSLLLFSWFVSPFIGIFLLSNTFNLGNVFFFHASHYVPVGVIGAIGFVNLVNFIAIKLKLRSQVILLPLLIILLLYFAVSWYGSIKKEISRWTPNIFNIFLARDFFSAFDYLNTNSQPESVVLAGEFLGTIIPAFTHNRTVAGHPVNTYDFTQKRLEVANFFTQNNSANAKEIIKKYNVAYTFFTYDTGVPQAAFINDLGLEMIYKNPIVTLFKTKYD